MTIEFIPYKDSKKPFYPIYYDREEIIRKATEYLNFGEIKELVKFLETTDLKDFKNKTTALTVGDYDFHYWGLV